VIFVTVGSMLPFNRLIATMDDWARRHPDEEVVAQIGNGSYTPTYMTWHRMLKNSDFTVLVAAASILVAHAGTGSVFAAFEHGKPIVLVPRYADAREHTTDHQVHTAKWLHVRHGIIVAERGEDIDSKIIEARTPRGELGDFSRAAPPEFLSRIRAAILQQVQVPVRSAPGQTRKRA
jgi:UDP-N-acetylglucosamine transferase subunit ALG13